VKQLAPAPDTCHFLALDTDLWQALNLSPARDSTLRKSEYVGWQLAEL
jgi:hypothetical protein